MTTTLRGGDRRSARWRARVAAARILAQATRDDYVRCPYCGARTLGPTCRRHADLPALDPFYGGLQ